MKLTHLGARYTPSNQTLDTVETDTQLSFLGQTFKMRTATRKPSLNLQVNISLIVASAIECSSQFL